MNGSLKRGKLKSETIISNWTALVEEKKKLDLRDYVLLENLRFSLTMQRLLSY